MDFFRGQLLFVSLTAIRRGIVYNNYTVLICKANELLMNCFMFTVQVEGGNL